MNTNEKPPRKGRRKENGRTGARHNALKHGLWARDVVLAHEDRKAFDAYLAAFRDHLTASLENPPSSGPPESDRA